MKSCKLFFMVFICLLKNFSIYADKYFYYKVPGNVFNMDTMREYFQNDLGYSPQDVENAVIYSPDKNLNKNLFRFNFIINLIIRTKDKFSSDLKLKEFFKLLDECYNLTDLIKEKYKVLLSSQERDELLKEVDEYGDNKYSLISFSAAEKILEYIRD